MSQSRNNNNNNDNNIFVVEVKSFLDFKDGEFAKQWGALINIPHDPDDTNEATRLNNLANKLEQMLAGRSVVEVVVKINLTSTHNEVPEKAHPFVERVIAIIQKAAADGLVINVIRARIHAAFPNKIASNKYKMLVLDTMKKLPLNINGSEGGYNYATPTTLSTVDPMTMERQDEDAGLQDSVVRRGLSRETRQGRQMAPGTSSRAQSLSVSVSIVDDPTNDNGNRILRIDSSREVSDVGQFVRELRAPLQRAFAGMRTGKLKLHILALLSNGIDRKALEKAIIDQIAFDALVIQTSE